MVQSGKRGGKYPRRVRPAVKSEVKREVKTLLARRSELKYIVDTQSQNVSTSGFIKKITDGIPTGSTTGQRIGDMINARSVELHGNILRGDASNFVRIIVFQWRVSDSTAPVLGDIIGSPAKWWDGYNGDKRSYYTILWDKTFPMSQNGSNDVVAFKKKIYKRMASRLEYETGASNSPGTHMLYYILLSDSGAIGHPLVNIYTKFNYKDE